MKRQIPQEETLGTAAVDLFASGMGAFILIALVFMVLFAATPTMTVAPSAPAPEPATPETAMLTCPTPEPCPQVVCPAIPAPRECPAPAPVPEPVEIAVCLPAAPLTCPEQPACPACPICPVPVEQLVEEAVSALSVPSPTPTEIPVAPICPEPDATLRLPEFDLVFVVDSTSSMHNEIESLKRELHILVEILERIMPTVGIGVVTFNDRRQSPAVRHHPLRRLTGNDAAMADLQRFLRGIAAGDGRGPNTDLPEAVLSALQTATSTSFREDVTYRSVIVITDAYAYDDELAESLALAREFGSVEGQRVSTVHIQANPQSRRYLEQLAAAGDGAFVPDRGSILANILLSIL